MTFRVGRVGRVGVVLPKRVGAMSSQPRPRPDRGTDPRTPDHIANRGQRDANCTRVPLGIDPFPGAEGRSRTPFRYSPASWRGG